MNAVGVEPRDEIRDGRLLLLWLCHCCPTDGQILVFLFHKRIKKRVTPGNCNMFMWRGCCYLRSGTLWRNGYVNDQREVQTVNWRELFSKHHQVLVKHAPHVLHSRDVRNGWTQEEWIQRLQSEIRSRKLQIFQAFIPSWYIWSLMTISSGKTQLISSAQQWRCFLLMWPKRSLFM